MKAKSFRIMTAAVALVVVNSISAAGPALAANPLNGPCNDTQINNNTWITRTASSTQSQGWITMVSATIIRYDYLLCTIFVIGPNVSSSGAWVAIEGTPTSGNNIVQDGYFKGQAGILNCCFDNNKLDYFWAVGQDNDLNHLPWPAFMGTADTASSHVFTTQLRFVGGAYQWQFLIDGVIRATASDSWRTWNRNKIEIGNEIWNCGDQLGGRTASGSDPGNKQKFTNMAWQNATSHAGGLSPSQLLGNAYPWGYMDDRGGTSAAYTWTDSHTSGNCSG